MSITMMFKCVSKTEKVDEENNPTFTLEFRRAYNTNGIELMFKRKTTIPAEANRFEVGEEYPIEIQEDDELGGVFAPCKPPAASATTSLPFQMDTAAAEEEETFEQRVARLTREAMDEHQEDANDDDTLVGWVFSEIGREIDDAEAYNAAYEEKKPELLPLVAAAAAEYRAEKRRAHIRDLAEGMLLVEQATCKEESGAEELSKAVFGAMYPDAAAAEGDEYDEIRREVELLLAERAAKAAGEEPAPAEETFEQKVARITRETLDAVPADASFTLEELALDVAIDLDRQREQPLPEEQFEALVEKITPLVKAAWDAHKAATPPADTSFDQDIERLTREELQNSAIAPKLIDPEWLTARVVDRLGEVAQGRDTTPAVMRAKELVPAILRKEAGEDGDRGAGFRIYCRDVEIPSDLLDALSAHCEAHIEEMQPVGSGNSTYKLTAPDGTAIVLCPTNDGYEIIAWHREDGPCFVGGTMAKTNVSRTIRGILGRTIQARIAARNAGTDRDFAYEEAHEAVHWIFNCVVSDTNWESAKNRLTDEELLYCLNHYQITETGKAKLRAEARRRGLNDPPQEYDAGLLEALRANDERWADLRAHGATDKQILDAIGQLWGLGGGASIGNMMHNWKGGKNPQYFYGKRGAGQFTVAGKQLARAARRLLAIPMAPKSAVNE